MKHGVVVGGGIAGLMAARVLIEYVERVTLIERDALPPTPRPRAGAAQGSHLHVLLKRGLDEIEALLPGFRERLIRSGGQRSHGPRDWYLHFAQGVCPRFESDLEFVTATRPLVEQVLRDHLLEYAGRHGCLELLDAATVEGIGLSPSRAPSLEIRRSAGAGRAPARLTLSPDICIDASGRNSRTPAWLAESGFPRPAQWRTRLGIGYATVLVDGAQPPAGCHAMLIQPQPPARPRTGALYAIEGGLSLCTLAGFCGDYPPDDEKGFRAFAASLHDPALAEALAPARLVGPIKLFRKDEAVFHRYHQVRRWPRGYVALGDAVANFNPIYGQGMTSAVLQSVALRRALGAGMRNAALQRKVARAALIPWVVASSEDLRWPSAGRRGLAVGVLQRFGDLVARAAARDVWACERYVKVLHMVEPMTRLMDPRAWWPGLRTAGRSTDG